MKRLVPQLWADVKRLPTTVRVIAADCLDYQMPDRAGARLKERMRCYVHEFRTWPEVFQTQPGTYHIRAHHEPPHKDTLYLIAWACIGAAAVAVGWVYLHAGIAAAVAAAVLLSPVLLFYSLGTRRLEIVINTDGLVGYRRFDGTLRAWMNFRWEKDYQITVRDHSLAGDTAAAHKVLEDMLAQLRQRWSGQGKTGPILAPPGANIHSEATELWIARGPSAHDAYLVAEFGPGRQGYVLGAAIQFVIGIARGGQGDEQREGRRDGRRNR